MDSVLARAVESKVQLMNKRIQDKKSLEIYKDSALPLTLDDAIDILEISESQQKTKDSDCLLYTSDAADE